MTTLTKLCGTISALFKVGGAKGPQWRGDFVGGAADGLSARNATNNAYVCVRGLTPAAADDLATKDYVDGRAFGVRFVDLTGGNKTTTASVSPGNTGSGHIHVTITQGMVCGLRVTAAGNTAVSSIEFYSDAALTKRIYYAESKNCYAAPYFCDYTPWTIPHFNGALTSDALYYRITNSGQNASTYDIEMTLLGA